MSEIHATERTCREEFSATFGNVAELDRIIDWLPLGEDVFVSRASALIDASPASASALAKFQQKYRSRQVELLQARLKLEKELAVLVEDAYGLTPEERQLLRDTRPIRDPIDVLEAKIAGKGAVVEAAVEDEE